MENFLKKLNYTSTQKHKYICHSIRYFQKIDSYEFINVGIFIIDTNKKVVKYKLISDEHLKKLYHCHFFDIEKLENAISIFREELNSSNLNEIINNRYINGLDTSFSFPYQTKDNIITLVNYLYDEMISYKFSDKTYEDKLHKTKKEVLNIIKSDFNNIFEQREEGLSVQVPLIDKRTKKYIDILVGSFINSSHFGEIITIFDPKSNSNRFKIGYINSEKEIKEHKNDFLNSQDKLFLLNENIDISNYSTLEDCYKNIKVIALQNFR